MSFNVGANSGVAVGDRRAVVIMAGVMAATFIVALRRLPRGRVETQETVEDPAPDLGSAQPAEVGLGAEPA